MLGVVLHCWTRAFAAYGKNQEGGFHVLRDNWDPYEYSQRS